MGVGVGAPTTSGQVDNILTSLAVELRKLMQEIANLNKQVNGGGAGLAYLESIGYGSASNPDNPSSDSDAQYANDLINHMYIIAGVYFGVTYHGGDATTPGNLSDFDLEFSPLWNGQF